MKQHIKTKLVDCSFLILRNTITLIYRKADFQIVNL